MDELVETSRMTADEARQAIEADKNARAQACHQEMQAALAKYRCAAEVEVLLKAGQILPRMILNALD